MTFLLNPIVSWLTGLITDAFKGLFTSMQRLLVSTPDVTSLPQVQTVTARATTVLDVVFVLAFLAAGVLTVASGSSERVRYTAKDLLPRLVVAFIAAHYSAVFTSRLIETADAVAAALTGTPDRRGAFAAIGSELDDSGGHVTPLLFLVLAAVVTFLFAAVAFAFVARLGVLIVLTVVAPLALACHALPHTDGIARLWWRSLAGCLIIPLLQVVTLQAGQTVLLDPHSAGVLFGVPGGGVLSLLVTTALLWMTVKIPGLVRKHVMQTRGGGGAQFLRVVVVGQGMRILTGGMSPGMRAVVRGGAALAGGRSR